MQAVLLVACLKEQALLSSGQKSGRSARATKETKEIATVAQIGANTASGSRNAAARDRGKENATDEGNAVGEVSRLRGCFAKKRLEARQRCREDHNNP